MIKIDTYRYSEYYNRQLLFKNCAAEIFAFSYVYSKCRFKKYTVPNKLKVPIKGDLDS